MIRTISVLVGAAVLAVLILVMPDHADAAPRQAWWKGRTVYVQSSLPGSFPVTKAVEVWDNRSRLNLIRVKRCPAGAQCIRLQPGRRPGRTLATTTKWMYPDRRIDRCRIVVDTRKFRAVSRLNTVSHEIGHCLGFEHTANRRDVMYKHNTRSRPWKPSTKHYHQLARIYGR